MSDNVSLKLTISFPGPSTHGFKRNSPWFVAVTPITIWVSVDFPCYHGASRAAYCKLSRTRENDRDAKVIFS
jgi:hypothetical protein